MYEFIPVLCWKQKEVLSLLADPEREEWAKEDSKLLTQLVPVFVPTFYYLLFLTLVNVDDIIE